MKSKNVKKPMAMKNGGSKGMYSKTERSLPPVAKAMAKNMVKKSGMPSKKSKRGK